VLQGLKWSVYPFSSYWRGTHEPAVSREVATLLTDETTVCWDIGSHFGYYAALMARRVGPQGEIVAVEANPYSFCYLERHMRMNRFRNVRFFRIAASDHPGVADILNYGAPYSPGAHLKYAGETVNPENVQGTTRVMRMDDLVAQEKLRMPELIKLDVEGHAGEALLGSRESLQARLPSIVVALHTREESLLVGEALEPLGYGTPRVINQPPHGQELRDCVFVHPSRPKKGTFN